MQSRGADGTEALEAVSIPSSEGLGVAAANQLEET
jgi:hypothetical protein